MTYVLAPTPAPADAGRLPQPADEAVRRAEAEWLRTVVAHHVPEPAPDQAALTARVLENERRMFGRQVTKLR